MKKELAISIDNLFEKISAIIESAKQGAYYAVNNTIVKTYWEIGKVIVEEEQEGRIRAEYGKEIMLGLSRCLTKEKGKGFSLSNLFNMRNFYVAYPIFQTVSGKLSWSHYCELISIDDENKRAFYEQESINSKWAVRELQRQLDSSLYERLLLSDGKVNKQKVMELAKKGQEIKTAPDIIKDPYVLEFLGIPEDKPILEKDLEIRLIRQIEDFLLELGKGFMYVGSQQRVTLANKHYYVDMVFYNKILHAYVLIDLKTGRLEPDHIGKMNMYLNYYKTEVNEDIDNEPVGIILCTSKNNVAAEYALGGLTNQVFASKYTYYLPDKNILEQKVKAALQSE